MMMKTFFAAAFLLLSVQTVFAAETAKETSPVGHWKQIDDETGKPRSIVRIEQENNEYVGYIEKLFPQPEDKPDPKCDKCEGEFKDKPVVGLKFIWGMKADGEKFTGGHILDPKNGTTYRCKMELKNKGAELKVRGFVGVSLFGRSQTWFRED
jgi:uncharacterized protein (DUF2147 family)